MSDNRALPPVAPRPRPALSRRTTALLVGAALLVTFAGDSVAAVADGLGLLIFLFLVFGIPFWLPGLILGVGYAVDKSEAARRREEKIEIVAEGIRRAQQQGRK